MANLRILKVEIYILQTILSSYNFHRFAPVVMDFSVSLAYLMPVLVARLGQQDITEPSEELRLLMLIMMTSFTDLCGSKMAPYLNDTVTILQRTLVDPYHEVKKVKRQSIVRR